MKRNGPKERMSESPQIAAECVQMMAAAEKRRKTLGNKARLETISANEQKKRDAQKQAIQNCQPTCTCAQAKGVTSEYRFSPTPPSYFVSFFPTHLTDIEIVNVWRSV